ncbi:MAG: hypothetical protein JW866_05010 [Ignavibacteriales bacterium]|nr:hypothetical protein [Ignavibacteriales bacterium]
MNNNILVPKIGEISTNMSGHHNLVWEMVNRKIFRRERGTWNELVNLIKNTIHEKIIITSEGFSHFSDKEIALIKKKLDNIADDIKIIIYLRYQPLILQSQWSQWARYHINFSKNFYEWLEALNYYFPLFDYQLLIDKWMNVFGKENILVRVLEQGQLDGPLFHDFLSTCGIERPGIYACPENFNISPGIKTLTMIQEIKKRTSQKINKQKQIKIVSYVREFGLDYFDEPKINLIDRETHDRIMERYMESNRKVGQEFFGREELFLEPFREKELTRFSVEDFKPEEILDAFVFTMEKMFPAGEKKNQKKRPSSNDNDYDSLKAQLDTIYTSRGWQALEKISAVRRKIQKLIKS